MSFLSSKWSLTFMIKKQQANKNGINTEYSNVFLVLILHLN